MKEKNEYAVYIEMLVNVKTKAENQDEIYRKVRQKIARQMLNRKKFIKNLRMGEIWQDGELVIQGDNRCL